MQNLIIVGAGGCGREVLQWCKDINKREKTWNILGFIDDNPMALDGYECDYGIIGSISDWVPHESEVFVLAIAAPKTKEIVVNKLKNKGAQFTAVIHPMAYISDFSEYGEGVIMYPGSSLNPNSRIGDFVTLLSSGIPHDAVIGNYVTISSNCGLTRGIQIGARAFLAAHVCILPEKKIGDDAYIGLGSVVVRNVPAGKKVFGNPARVIDL